MLGFVIRFEDNLIEMCGDTNNIENLEDAYASIEFEFEKEKSLKIINDISVETFAERILQVLVKNIYEEIFDEKFTEDCTGELDIYSLARCRQKLRKRIEELIA